VKSAILSGAGRRDVALIAWRVRHGRTMTPPEALAFGRLWDAVEARICNSGLSYLAAASFGESDDVAPERLA